MNINFPCSEFDCGKVFSTKLLLKQHQRTHVEGWPFVW